MDLDGKNCLIYLSSSLPALYFVPRYSMLALHPMLFVPHVKLSNYDFFGRYVLVESNAFCTKLSKASKYS